MPDPPASAASACWAHLHFTPDAPCPGPAGTQGLHSESDRRGRSEEPAEYFANERHEFDRKEPTNAREANRRLSTRVFSPSTHPFTRRAFVTLSFPIPPC